MFSLLFVSFFPFNSNEDKNSKKDRKDAKMARVQGARQWSTDQNIHYFLQPNAFDLNILICFPYFLELQYLIVYKDWPFFVTSSFIEHERLFEPRKTNFPAWTCLAKIGGVWERRKDWGSAHTQQQTWYQLLSQSQSSFKSPSAVWEI